MRLGERLSATLPDGLDTWFFVCMGSEANDLAVRMAQLVTGRSGVAVMGHSYHGNTSVLAPLSLLDYDIADKPDWVEALPPPNVYRGLYRAGDSDLGARYAAHVPEAAGRLRARGRPMAALLMDSIFDANGALVPPQDYMRLAYDEAHRLGALTIADEVQMRFARSGTHMWGFQAYNVRPDIVTMSKPMGNGHPIAAVVTHREITLEFQPRNGYFNTFGGNTVSAVVANATLDVLQGDALQDNALRVGTCLETSLRNMMQRHELVGHIHGRGLFYEGRTRGGPCHPKAGETRRTLGARTNEVAERPPRLVGPVRQHHKDKTPAMPRHSRSECLSRGARTISRGSPICSHHGAADQPGKWPILTQDALLQDLQRHGFILDVFDEHHVEVVENHLAHGDGVDVGDDHAVPLQLLDQC
ncbi:hypothetical protein J2848_002745 [Azospirillum lipoferum]|uniref:Aminotransferase class III-fold pyridoxal phosphate-dependent enzyme n=1 Tax=Azospirillum lipoferum TaxID=193 RepID=A0A5A9GQR5_AZOLI|nr:aminotransferase class III-fold pyridoxal phosphate-dependent enzyme [Azospirillum lipoferum]MCP1611072.1 hypothetical protein [Azospirillum lipoferum]